jgi:hypothetical protein
MRVVRRLVPLLLLLAVWAAAPGAAQADYARRVVAVAGVGAYATDGRQVVRLTTAGAVPVGQPVPRAGRDLDVMAVSPFTGTILLQDRHRKRVLRMDGATGRWGEVGPRDPRSTTLTDPLAAADAPVWIRSSGDVVLRSTDDGRTWRRWARAPELLGSTLPISALAWDPSEPGALLAGTFGGHLYRLDASARWHHLALTRADDVRLDWVTGIVADATRPGQILASLFGAGVGRSVDGGRTFRILHPRFHKGGVFRLVGAPEGHAWGVTFNGNDFATHDGGRTWASAQLGLERDVRGYLTEIAPDGASPGNAYAIKQLGPLEGWYGLPDGRWVALPSVYGG